MSNSERDERLVAELEAMQALKQESDLFDFEALGEPPNKYVVTFRGRGVSRGLMTGDEPETIELHRCELRLSYSYPNRPPDIRWLTPIFHPNISFSGTIRLDDVGLPWDKNVSLDVVCERIWDMARLAYVNLDKASNYSAKKWLEGGPGIALPTDSRSLRGGTSGGESNVVRYERSGGGQVAWPDATGDDEILYIDDDTPTPQMPPRVPPRVSPPRRFDDDDDILYIE